MLLALILAATASATSQLPSNCAAAAGFVGTICTPAGSGKHPAIVLLGGSEGGDSMAPAAPMFAARGYVAVSVAYFRGDGLPATLENIPVETVGNALDLTAKRPDVDPSRIAIFGISKGGELALLTASLHPQIHAVIAGVPSPFAWQGIAQGPGEAKSSWTVGGKPAPYVEYGSVMYTQIQSSFVGGQPLALRKAYVESMQEHAAQIPAAMFHLENIRGPVLMLGADDDGIWDSVAQSQLGMKYLQEHKHPYADEFVHYAGAGHLFLFSSTDRPMTQVPMGPVTIVLGGTPQANVQAGTAAWPKIFAFLSAALK